MSVKNTNEFNGFLGSALKAIKTNIGVKFNLGRLLASLFDPIAKSEEAFADFKEIGGELAEATISEKAFYKEAFDQEIAGSFDDPRDEYDVSAAFHGIQSIYSLAKRAGKKEGQEEGIRAALRMIRERPELLDDPEGNTVQRMVANLNASPDLVKAS